MGYEGALDQSGRGKVVKKMVRFCISLEDRDSKNSAEEQGLSRRIIGLCEERDGGTRPPGKDPFHPGFQLYLPQNTALCLAALLSNQ